AAGPVLWLARRRTADAGRCRRGGADRSADLDPCAVAGGGGGGTATGADGSCVCAAWRLRCGDFRWAQSGGAARDSAADSLVARSGIGTAADRRRDRVDAATIAGGGSGSSPRDAGARGGAR